MWEWLRRIAFRVQGSLLRKRLEDDFDAEVQSHLAQMIDENMARGMTRDEARRAALLLF